MNMIEKLSRRPKRAILPHLGECYITAPPLRSFMLARDAETDLSAIVRIIADCIVDEHGKPCISADELVQHMDDLDGLKIIELFQAIMSEFAITQDELKKTVTG